MSWKRNAFSCLMWLSYLLMVGPAVIFTGRALCDSLGMAAWFGIAIPAACLLVTGIIVFLLHRLAAGLDAGFRNMGKSLAWMERILILVLFAAGLFLRVTQMRPDSFAPAGAAYLERAYISGDGQGFPRVFHTASQLYIQALRLCFRLLGNKAAAAVWLQVGLQVSAVALLYAAVRKMAGRFPAAMTAALFMLSPYMIQKSLEPSPEMLYMLLFSMALLFAAQGVERPRGWGFWLVGGIMAAALCYLDVEGFLLLPLMCGVIVIKRQEAGGGIFRGLCGCMAGGLLGAAGCLLGDALIGGKPVAELIRMWVGLYRWTGFYRWKDVLLFVTLSDSDALWPVLLVLWFMAWGIFSFWCGKKTERFTAWIFCLNAAILLRFMGIFTGNMDGSCFIFFFSAVLAGLGIRESMAFHAEDMEEETVEENGGTDIKGGMPDSDITEEAEAAGGENTETAGQPENPRVKFLENPLPLPKKHEKRVMDYQLDPGTELGGYDVFVADDDDFDH
ncbi:MAG: glycosyltransferase family 39 protein [Blautia sp.]|nr:glycosyltransferase family 39 protein [Blautia sp.]